MSVSNVIVPGAVQYPVCTRLTATTITDCYTATDNLDTIIAIVMVNETTTPCELLIDWYNGSANAHIDAFSFTTAAGRCHIFDVPFRVFTGHKIRATASVANLITIGVYIAKTQRAA